MRLFSGRYLIPGEAPPLEGGALLEVDGRIAAVGPATELRRVAPEAETVDWGEALLVPLLVNAHTHLELTDFPAWAARAGEEDEPGSFVDWILRLIRVKADLDLDAFSFAVSRGLSLSLAAGTGAVGDVLAHYPARRAYGATPLSGVAFLETLGRDPARIAEVEGWLDEALAEAPDGPFVTGVSPHSPYTVRSSYLARVYEKVRSLGLRCTTHLAESREEVELLDKGRGAMARRFFPAIGWGGLIPRASHRSPVEVLAQAGGLFPENLLVHGVQLTTPEIETLARQRMRLALCPRSNARLQVGRAPVEKLVAARVPLCLGTDSLASNDSLSLWDEMAFAHRWFDGALDPPTLLRMATVGGAEALGLERDLGSLDVGKSASFAVLRPRTLPGSGEVFDYLVSPGRSAEIEQVILRGEREWPQPEAENPL